MEAAKPDSQQHFGPQHAALDARIYLLAGLSYPWWRFLSPGGADPLWPWLAISGMFLAIAWLVRTGRLRDVAQHDATILAAGLVTLHFMLLAHKSEMQPFYAVGSSMALMMTVLFVRRERVLFFYAACATSTALALYIAEPDPRKVAYWAGPLPVFAFAYVRIRTQSEFERSLELLVEERTRALTSANRRLREESATRGRLEKELRVQHKVEAVGRLAGGVAHDFNTLLTTIGIYADLIHDGLPEDSELREEIRYIQQAQRQATTLTQELLTLGRRSHARLDVIDLNQVIRENVALLRRILRPQHELQVALGDAEYPILGNIDQLQRILLNLAMNAADAMPGPGQLRMETAIVTRDQLVQLNLASPFEESPEFVCFSVTDTGVGMTPEARDRAFDPFYTTKADSGSGLGLSIVHGIVSQAGGYVRLASEPGHGARFDLYWPSAAKPSDAPVASPASHQMPHGSRILLVDDETPLRAAVQRVLSSAGCFVQEAGDGVEALEIARREPFDLVITDAVMPRMSGVDLADHLRAELPGTRLLVMSAHLNDDALKQVAPDLPFLAKPFAPKEFLERVEALLSAPAPEGRDD